MTNVRWRVKLDRVDDTRRDLKRELSREIERTIHNIEAGAKQRAPVRTGNLRNSIGSEMESDLEGLITVGAEYGLYVEEGTRRMAARPYLRPAVEAERPRMQARLRAAKLF